MCVSSPVDIIVVIVSNKTDIHPAHGQNGHQREKTEPAAHTLWRSMRENKDGTSFYMTLTHSHSNLLSLVIIIIPVKQVNSTTRTHKHINLSYQAYCLVSDSSHELVRSYGSMKKCKCYTCLSQSFMLSSHGSKVMYLKLFKSASS